MKVALDGAPVYLMHWWMPVDTVQSLIVHLHNFCVDSHNCKSHPMVKTPVIKMRGKVCKQIMSAHSNYIKIAECKFKSASTA